MDTCAGCVKYLDHNGSYYVVGPHKQQFDKGRAKERNLLHSLSSIRGIQDIPVASVMLHPKPGPEHLLASQCCLAVRDGSRPSVGCPRSCFFVFKTFSLVSLKATIVHNFRKKGIMCKGELCW